MREAKVDGQLIQADPNSPETALCPACGGSVSKRKRRNMDGSVTYFYRHAHGEGDTCPLRHRPFRLPHRHR